MRVFKKVLYLVPLLLLWLMLSVMVWGAVFTRITDAPAEEKLTVYIDGPVREGTELAAALEKNALGRVRMVKVHPFDYAMFDLEAIAAGDLYIAPETDADTYRDWFAPLPETLLGAGEILYRDDVPLGVRVYDAGTGEGCLKGFILYPPAGTGEDWYLFLGAASRHVSGHDGAVDDAAVPAAEMILKTE
ncbi:MAG: hypothetical protein IJR97_08515 [Clostridia bacterium]|nr:hypothetical protein [Clostridia bacterium]